MVRSSVKGQNRIEGRSFPRFSKVAKFLDRFSQYQFSDIKNTTAVFKIFSYVMDNNWLNFGKIKEVTKILVTISLIRQRQTKMLKWAELRRTTMHRIFTKSFPYFFFFLVLAEKLLTDRRKMSVHFLLSFFLIYQRNLSSGERLFQNLDHVFAFY